MKIKTKKKPMKSQVIRVKNRILCKIFYVHINSTIDLLFLISFGLFYVIYNLMINQRVPKRNRDLICGSFSLTELNVWWRCINFKLNFDANIVVN